MTKKDNDKLVMLGVLMAGSLAIEALRIGSFKRGVRAVTGHDLSWRQALWAVTTIRIAGGLFEEGRRASASHQENIDRLKEKYGV